MNTTKLYRPVGLKELELIKAAAWRKFPPRLAWQPIFYPVLNQEYAEAIASQWNTKDESSGYCGVVLEFDIDSSYSSKFPVQNVGGMIHEELWVPAEELDEFNDHIIDEIRVIKVFIGEGFVQPPDAALTALLYVVRDQK